MVLNHEIFKTPFAVTPTVVVEPHNRDASRTVENWIVFEADDSIEIGLVSNRAKLAGALDTEILSGGVNTKGDRGVALAREANMFQWGFTGPPSAMTDEARKVFVNSVCYIAKYDGHSIWSKDSAALAATIAVEKPARSKPVTAAAAFLEPSAKQGDTVTLAVRVQIATGWHIYGKVAPNSPYPETELVLELPEGVQAVGDWERPKSHTLEGNEVYEGDVAFLRKLRIGDKASHLEKIECVLHYQACDAMMCMPPSEQRLSASVSVRRR